MRSLIIKKLSLSNFSIACLFFLFFGFLRDLEKFSKIELLSIIILISSIIILFNKRKSISLVIGICLFLTHVFITCIYHSTNKFKILDESNWKEFSGHNILIEITSTEKINKNYLEVDVILGSDVFKAILNKPSRSNSNQTFNCSKNNISFFNANQESQFFDFLKKYKYLFIKMKNCELIKEEKTIFHKIKDTVELSLFEGGIQYSSRDIAMGIIFGDTSYLNSELKNSSLEGGVIHLFAASGLHMGIIIGVLHFFFKKIIKMNYFYSKITPVLIGFFYLYLLNFPVSLFRAYFFTCFWLVSKITFRKSKPINMFIICSTAIYSLQRSNFLSVGFLLSFGATLGIVYLKQILDKVFFNNHKNFLTQNITISLSASLGTFPFLIYFFKSFSFGSLILNIIIVPLAGFALPLLYICLIIHQAGIEDISNLFWTLCDFLLRSIIFLTLNLSDKFGFFKKYTSIEFILILLYCLFIFLLIILNRLYFPESFFKEQNEKGIEYLYSSFREKIKKIILQIKINLASLFVPIISFFTLIIFSYIGYNIKVVESNKVNSYFHVGYNQFIIEENKKLYIEGDCKYSSKYLLKLEKSSTLENLDEIHITNITCLSFVLRNRNSAKIIFHASFYNKKTNLKINLEVLKSFPEVEYSSEYIPHHFLEKNIIFFSPHLESIYELRSKTINKEGSIYLMFPFKTIDSPKEWNDNKLLLGISDRWTFYSYTYQ